MLIGPSFFSCYAQTYENFMNSVVTKHEEGTNRRYIELNDCRRFAKIADRTHADSSHSVQQSLNWLNVIIARIFFSLSTEQTIVEAIMGEIQKKLLVMSISPIFDTIKLISFNLGKTSPVIHSVDDPPIRDFWAAVVNKFKSPPRRIIAMKTFPNPGIRQAKRNILELSVPDKIAGQPITLAIEVTQHEKDV
ncbi:conserved hypothetical protein, partial [Trichinella spiralis]|uniref:hypothetical protein n=1 Tax=Trichinella spiralis TaxID=6334 RepID=UPI0001EFD47A